MKKFILSIFAFMFCLPALADYIQFDKMDTFKCVMDETIYNSDNSVVSQNNYERIYRLDDLKNQIYLQKSPVNSISVYNTDEVEFNDQSMTDDFIMSSHVKLNRKTGEITSDGTINYDNSAFGQRYSKAHGNCTLQK